jgi:hypothetical protein
VVATKISGTTFRFGGDRSAAMLMMIAGHDQGALR